MTPMSTNANINANSPPPSDRAALALILTIDD